MRPEAMRTHYMYACFGVCVEVFAFVCVRERAKECTSGVCERVCVCVREKHYVCVLECVS